MGLSFSNLHVHSSERDLVKDLVANEDGGLPSYVAKSATNGWLSVYPSTSDDKNLEKLCLKLSKKLQTAVFLFDVHDSDTFVYILAENGRTADKFHSWPGYFEGADPRPRGGKVKSVLKYCQSTISEQELQSFFKNGELQIWDGEGRAYQLSKYLGIPASHACTSFELLDEKGVSDASFVELVDKIPGEPEAPKESPLNQLLERVAALDTNLAQLAGIPQALAALKGSEKVRGCNFDGTEFPRLDKDKEIVPIENIDELIEVFTRVLASNQMDDVERVFAALCQLSNHLPDDFAQRVGPLRTATKPFVDSVGPHKPLAALALSWAQRSREPMDNYIGRAGGYARERNRLSTMYMKLTFESVGARALGLITSPLLSAATHAGGWIDPVVLAERAKIIAKMGETTRDLVDECMSLLRLAPDNRAQALEALGTTCGHEFIEALRYALGDPAVQVGETAVLWIAAARARAPFADAPEVEAHHPGFGPNAGMAAKYKLVAVPCEYPPKLIEEEPTPADARADLEIPLPVQLSNRAPGCAELQLIDVWSSRLWPLNQEPIFAQGLPRIAFDGDNPRLAKHEAVYLQRLLDPDVPMKQMALYIVSVALAKEASVVCGPAKKVLAAAISDGRIDGLSLGQALASLAALSSEPRVISLPQWTKAFKQTAKVSALHLQVIVDALPYLLTDECGHHAEDFVALLELLKELLTASGESLGDQACQYLKSLSVSANAEARVSALALLAMATKPELQKRQRKDAALFALSHRLDRAERWVKRIDARLSTKCDT